jgi:1-acyl-sn-glycerol-3-phosphate acyltransferase
MAFGRFWARGTLWLLAVLVGLRHELRGAEHLPKGASLVAMKHQSAWDTIVLPLVLGDPAVVLKRELLWIPIYGWYTLASGGAIAIDRKAAAAALRSMVARARKIAAERRPVVIFPEGTRVAPGQSRPYQPGVAALYKELGLPLVPIAVDSGLYWGRRAFLKRPGRIVIEILPPIAPGLPRREVMAELERRIEEASDRLLATAPAAAENQPQGKTRKAGITT